MDSNKKNYLWGAGNSAIEFLDAYSNILFEAVIESSPSGETFRGLSIIPPKHADLKYSNIVVASEFFEEIRETALKLGASPENIFYASDIALKDATAAVISYQKCGRTWLRLMLGRIFQQKFGLPETEALRITQSPMRFNDISPKLPKVIFHHDDSAHRKTAEQLALSKDLYFGKKIIFLCRDPRDVILSNYYHMTFRAKRNSLNKEEFIKKYLSGIIKFYNIWINAKVESFLLVRFEDLKSNASSELQRILDFLDPDLTIPIALIEEAVEYCKLSNMSKYEAEDKFGSCILSNQGGQESAKVRRGKIGGFRAELDEALQCWCHQKIKDLDRRYGYI